MRSKATNLLQGIVLVTGVIYLIVGLMLYLSPLTILKLFAENVSENWLDHVRDNELVAPLYYFTRGFSAMVFTSGIAMVMPLFDPLKYRGLIYYNGLIFPLLASLVFLYNGLVKIFISGESFNVSGEGLSGYNVHLPVVILGIVFAFIFLLTAVGLLLTKKLAHQGIE